MRLPARGRGRAGREGRDAYSTYGCGAALEAAVAAAMAAVAAAMAAESGLVAGPPWFQGDHAIFSMHGVPALAVTSERIEELMSTVIHTSADTIELVDPPELVRLAGVLRALIGRMGAEA